MYDCVIGEKVVMTRHQSAIGNAADDFFLAHKNDAIARPEIRVNVRSAHLLKPGNQLILLLVSLLRGGKIACYADSSHQKQHSDEQEDASIEDDRCP